MTLPLLLYVLDDDGNPLACDDVIVWADWFERSSRNRTRIVAQDEDDDVLVSTVFLGIDHSYLSGPPVLWETMVFGGPFNGEQRRYTSQAEALAGHQEVCAAVAKHTT